MYSVGPLPRQKKSGRVIGTHQKIDRIARRHLSELIGIHATFPKIKEILHFEGTKGPDGLKLKSPGVDEPLHFINPDDPADGPLIAYMREHSSNLESALRDRGMVRAAFEASWLAHVITDGLTPAHQVPYQEQVQELLGDQEAVRDKVRDKVLIKGATRRDTVKNSWQYWGPKGILSTHTLFEAGVATVTRGYRFAASSPSTEDLMALRDRGYEALYIDLVREVAALDMYENFKQQGWNERLARQTTGELMPRIIRAVTLAWYDAYLRSREDRSS